MYRLLLTLVLVLGCEVKEETYPTDPLPPKTQSLTCSSSGSGSLTCDDGSDIPLPPTFPHADDCNECITTVEGDMVEVNCPNGIHFKFKTVKGKDGENGKDGHSCSVTSDGWVECTDGTRYKLLRGPKGDKGEKGDPGEPGETIIITEKCPDCWSFGAHGNVYTIPEWTSQMPDYDNMTPEETITVDQFDLFDEPSALGFPGMPHRLTWYGIKFTGYILVPECSASLCKFRLTSDDGAILTIGGVEVINNDGLHPPTVKYGSLLMAKGWHEFRLDWYQGPHTQIALALEISTNGGADWRLVEYSELKFNLE